MGYYLTSVEWSCITVSLMAAMPSLFPLASYFYTASLSIVHNDIRFQCLVQRCERRPIYIEGTGHMPTLLKALAHGEWWMPAVSTDKSTSSGAAYCWSLQFMTTCDPAHHVPQAMSSGRTYARNQIPYSCHCWSGRHSGSNTH